MEREQLSEQIVDSILDGNKESFMAAFQAAIAAKVTDSLEVKKVEIASGLIGVETPELAVEEEVDLEESKKEMDDEMDDEEEDEEEDDEDEDEDEEDSKNMKEEAKGKLAVTPKEKALAAHHGNPKRITFGDVVKARIKSAKNEEAEQTDEELDQLSGRFLVSTDPSKQRYLSTERGRKNAAKKNVANLKYYIKHSLGKHPKPNLPEEAEQIDEVTPPGREKQVKALKGKVRNPYAVAWASYNKSKKNK